jgi:acetyl-CoA C-acetyltransferase
MSEASSLWLAAGLRTPFSKVDSQLAALDAIQLSVPVVQAMCAQLKADKPDLVVWGSVAPSLRWSNIAREVVLDAGVGPTIPAFTTIAACSTSMQGVFAAAAQLMDGRGSLALVGGAESMSRVQIGLSQKLSDWMRRFFQARSLSQRAEMLGNLPLKDVRLHIPSVTNRTTGKSMGEGCEDMAKAWKIPRDKQDEIALMSHQRAVAAGASGFFADLILPVAGVGRDTMPRPDTSLEKLAKLPPVFDRTSGRGTLSAGNSTLLTDGAASVWLANTQGLARLPSHIPRVRLLDWEIAAVDMEADGLLMAPAFGVPRLLARHNLRYDSIALWEIHEAFAAQVLCHVAAWEDEAYVRNRAGVTQPLGQFPWERYNPNGGSVALGHPFGATGARILSQSVKELAAMPSGSLAVVSICADGGIGTMALLQAA